MKEFLQKFGGVVIGVLSGFDRVLFRGTLRGLCFGEGMTLYLSLNKIMFKDAGAHFEAISNRVKNTAERRAAECGRRVEYLESPGTNKEERARQIAAADGITTGLVCVLKTVEPCRSFCIQRDAKRKQQHILCATRKCLHYYFYYQHAELGLMHVRLQSWFPFTIHICINGREWLARSLDREGIAYQQRENCFLRLTDVERAQQLADAQLKTDWPALLDGFARAVNPLCPELFGKFQTQYYWSVPQMEWATDLMFESRAALAEIYPRLIRHGIQTFKSPDVMRFLGRYLMPNGGLHPRFNGEVVSDLKERLEGVRLKHRAGDTSVKLYDKFGRLLRIELTSNGVRGFKVFRPLEGGREDRKAWHCLRKGVADLHRRAQLSQACNERYLAALAQVETTQSLEEVVQPICRPVRFDGRRARALNPLGGDSELLSVLGRGEYAINGFRNRDLQEHLYGAPARDCTEQKRRSSKVTRQLRLLRAHGLIRKVPKTHRYQLTETGRGIVAAVSAAKQASTKKLIDLAA